MDDEQPGDDEALTAPNALIPWLERQLGRRLGDMRIHDSRQAGELAERLGARAFAVGRDVYVRPELLRQGRARGRALLAHEAMHVAEQTAAPSITPPAMPGPALPHPAPAARVAVQRAPPGTVVDAGEQGAQATEGATFADQQQRRRRPRPDPQAIAEQVYRRLVADARTGRERWR